MFHLFSVTCPSAYVLKEEQENSFFLFQQFVIKSTLQVYVAIHPPLFIIGEEDEEQDEWKTSGDSPVIVYDRVHWTSFEERISKFRLLNLDKAITPFSQFENDTRMRPSHRVLFWLFFSQNGGWSWKSSILNYWH